MILKIKSRFLPKKQKDKAIGNKRMNVEDITMSHLFLKFCNNLLKKICSKIYLKMQKIWKKRKLKKIKIKKTKKWKIECFLFQK
jgi:hypothetical protein